MKDIIYIIAIVGVLVYFAFQRANDDNELLIAKHEITQLTKENDSIQSHIDTLIIHEIQTEVKIKKVYEKIYISVDTLSDDSIHSLFSTIYR